MIRTSDLICRVPPTRSNSRSWSTRSSFACSIERHVADLVEEQRPAVGQLERAPLALTRAGEGAALVAEELALEQVSGIGRAVDGHERPVAAAGWLVDGRGDELLAGAALARDEDRRVWCAPPGR